MKAGIDVPAVKVVRLTNAFHTFCVRRFDRTNGVRADIELTAAAFSAHSEYRRALR